MATTLYAKLDRKIAIGDEHTQLAFVAADDERNREWGGSEHDPALSLHFVVTNDAPAAALEPGVTIAVQLDD